MRPKCLECFIEFSAESLHDFYKMIRESIPLNVRFLLFREKQRHVGIKSFLVFRFLNSLLSESCKVFDIDPGEGNIECLLFCRDGPLRQSEKGSVLETIQDENWGLLLLELG